MKRGKSGGWQTRNQGHLCEGQPHGARPRLPGHLRPQFETSRRSGSAKSWIWLSVCLRLAPEEPNTTDTLGQKSWFKQKKKHVSIQSWYKNNFCLKSWNTLHMEGGCSLVVKKILRSQKLVFVTQSEPQLTWLTHVHPVTVAVSEEAQSPPLYLPIHQQKFSSAPYSYTR